MTKTKFILTNKKTGLSEKHKTLRTISELLEIDYHQARAIYIYSTKGKKHIFPITKVLCEEYSIVDDPEYLKIKH